jgi:hypothetical protein
MNNATPGSYPLGVGRPLKSAAMEAIAAEAGECGYASTKGCRLRTAFTTD